MRVAGHGGGYGYRMSEESSHLSTSHVAPEAVPAEEGEGLLTSAESREKADPSSPRGSNAHTADDEFTDPSAQPPA